MELAKMSPSTRYGTCHGHMVQVMPNEDGELHSRWAKVKDPETDEDTFVELTEGSELSRKSNDPWGDCTPRHRVGKIGARVKLWKVFDRDGEPVGEPDEVVMLPRDIRGTWKDYMVLHGAVIREKADEHARQEAEERLRDAIRERVMAAFGLPEERDWLPQDNRGRPEVTLTNVTASLEDFGNNAGLWNVCVYLSPEEAEELIANA